MNLLINRKRKSNKQIQSLRRADNSLATTLSEISTVFNKHFASVGERLSAKIPYCSIHYSQYLPKRFRSTSFIFDTVLPGFRDKDSSCKYGFWPVFMSYSNPEIRLPDPF